MPDASQNLASQRKNATVLFADLSGFTAMSANLDPEEVRDIVNRYFEALAGAVRRYEGTIDKYIGDCVMAVFGVPATRANDAERACRAALDMLSAVRELASGFGDGVEPPDIHIGINTGLVVAAPMGSGDTAQFTVMGDPVNFASRLCHEAENGQIAIGESTWALVANDFEFAPKELRSIKGKGDKVPVYFLVGRSEKAARQPNRAEPPMVGREREISVAQNLLADAQNKHGALLYITGDPGIGKSRLSSEMAKFAAANGYRILDAAAQPLATIEPYGLWRQLLERSAGVASGMVARETDAAFAVVLQGASEHAEQTIALRATLGLATPEFQLLDDDARFQAIRRGWNSFVLSLAAEAPLLLILDDLQWADTYSLRLLDAMVDAIPGRAMVLCCMARPEFRHSWANRSDFHPIELRPLSSEECMALARSLAKEGSTCNDAEVVARAEGNPFYLTELSRAAAHSGDGKLPPTIEAVILERIDRLERQSRQVLELASVIGREFSERVLRAVANSEHLDSQLPRLRELEFIYEKELAPELLYLFKHYLTQEATYNSILLKKRKEMHAQVAAAMEQIYKDSLERYAAVLAQHYEKAADYRKAFECYRQAGDNAQDSTGVSAATQFYDRGETALKMLHEDRPAILNKLKYFAVTIAISVALIFVFAPRNFRVDGSFLPSGATVIVAIFAVLVVMIPLASSSKRWSFAVYPDRIRVRSRRRSFDIDLERVTGVELVSSRSWKYRYQFMYFDPLYPMYGLGQLRKVSGTHELLRVDCPHRGWRKGYYLNMEDPRPFLQTLNRALQRVRLMQASAPSETARESEVRTDNHKLFGPKEISVLLIAAALAIAGWRSADPKLVAPCLLVSWAGFIYFCFIYGGSPRLRISMAAIITLSFFFLGPRIYSRRSEGQIAEVEKNLSFGALLPSEKPSETLFWARNGSSIALDFTIGCKVLMIVDGGSSRLSGPWKINPVNSWLEPGDMESNQCLTSVGDESPPIVCADVQLKYVYTLETQPDEFQVKSSRFAGYREGDKFQWYPRDLDYKGSYCDKLPMPHPLASP
jgi:class 3 adenylate cyclase